MKDNIVGLLLPLIVLLGPATYRSYAHVPSESAFRMKVVDATSGLGVPHVEVRSDNGIVCHTRANGEIAWTETVLMERDVRFSIKLPNNDTRETVTLRVSRKGSTTVILR
jgi:hypothetical protein